MNRLSPERVERWNEILRPYWGADTRKSVTQLLTSAIPFVLLWYTMFRSLEIGYWLTLLLAVPTAGFMMRLFMIQHDCGHGSFFKSRKARDVVGFCIGVLMLTPYAYWRKAHAAHHAHSGDLDFRGFGDIETLTVQEYLSLSWFERLKYRLYRHPLVLFGIGPAFIFLVKHRFPHDIPKTWRTAWHSVWWTNGLIAVIVAIMWTTIGIDRFLLVHTPVFLVAGTLGVWLFYIQHQYEQTYWRWHGSWDYYDSALFGSSYLVLPKPLQWITANIGIHHVHHMSSRIPNYKLQAVHDENPEFHGVHKVTMADTWRLINLALWDEEQGRLIRFKDLRRRAKRLKKAA